MSGMTNACAKLVLDAALGGAAFSPATYLALATATILRTDGDALDVSECAYTSYARAAISDSDWAAAADPGVKTNDTLISLPQCTGAPEVATDVFIVDSASGSGLVVLYAELGVPLSIVNGMTPQFDIGALTWNANPAA